MYLTQRRLQNEACIKKVEDFIGNFNSKKIQERYWLIIRILKFIRVSALEYLENQEAVKA